MNAISFDIWLCRWWKLVLCKRGYTKRKKQVCGYVPILCIVVYITITILHTYHSNTTGYSTSILGIFQGGMVPFVSSDISDLPHGSKMDAHVLRSTHRVFCRSYRARFDNWKHPSMGFRVVGWRVVSDMVSVIVFIQSPT